MQKIIPFLWYDKEAHEAATLYVSVFKDAKIKKVSRIENTPSGTVETIDMEIFGQEFGLMSAGPYFKFTPAVSFIVCCDTKEEVDRLWKELGMGGKVLMPLDTYPFSERYGWTEDKYGVSWQIIFMGNNPIKQRIIPSLMFIGDNTGKAHEAMKFYTAIFHNAKMGDIMHYGKGQEPDKESHIAYGSFTIEGQEFAAMDSGRMHAFNFNEAISFVVNCNTQEEIDYYWKSLSADPKSEQCGWLKDKYGLSWQIVPTILNKMLADTDKKKVERVTQAFLKMKKFNIQKLEEAAKV